MNDLQHAINSMDLLDYLSLPCTVDSWEGVRLNHTVQEYVAVSKFAIHPDLRKGAKVEQTSEFRSIDITITRQ